MNKKKDLKIVAMNAMIACVYAALTIAIAPLAYGEIQARISEVIVFLAFYNRKYIPGLVVGCLISNIPSTLGAADMVFGTFSTLCVCLAMYYLKNIYLAALAGGAITGIIVGAELSIIFKIPFLINAVYVFIGEFIVLLIGAVLFKMLEKNENFMTKYIYE